MLPRICEHDAAIHDECGLTIMSSSCVAIAVAWDDASVLNGNRQGRPRHGVSETALRDAQPKETQEMVGSVDRRHERIGHGEDPPILDIAVRPNPVKAITTIGTEAQMVQSKTPRPQIVPKVRVFWPIKTPSCIKTVRFVC